MRSIHRALVPALVTGVLMVGVAALAQPVTPERERPSTEAERIALGLQLVRRDCAGCHAIERRGDSPMDKAPRFRDLHDQFDVELLSESLAEGIVVGHGAMPVWIYGPVEIESIVAYLKSLEPAPKR